MKMEIKTVLFCWCDGSGIGHPMDVVEGRMFKCSKCKVEVSVTLLDKNFEPLSIEGEDA